MSHKGLVSVMLVAAKLVATGIAFWLVLRTIDIEAARQAAARISAFQVGAALALLGTQVAINGARWAAIARSSGIGVPLPNAILYLWEGLFFGQLTPSGLGGDAWRAYAVSRGGKDIAGALNSVIVDRLIGVAALVLMVFAAFASEVARGEALDGAEVLAGVLLAGAATAGVTVLLAVQYLRPGRAESRIGRLVEHARKVSALLGEALQKPKLLAASLAASVLGQVFCAVAVWVIAIGVGADLPPPVFLVAVPLALLVSMIPITIAGWGVREGVLAGVLAHAGLSMDHAATIAVLFGLALAFLGLTGGIALWFGRWRGGRSAAQAGERPPQAP